MKKIGIVIVLSLFGVFTAYADDFVELTPYFFAKYEGIASAASFRTSPSYNNTNQVQIDLENFLGRKLARCFYISDQNSDSEDQAVEQETMDLLARNITGYPNISVGAVYDCIYIREAGVDGYLIYMRYNSSGNWEWYTYYYSLR
ncbi:MAG: hypothetical protein FWF22_00920 [Treponema sp.]|nr:hypothetical protein [Treponema sp.]